jgi:ferredoxin hydrogenase large subunit/hydrogenase large subunit
MKYSTVVSPVTRLEGHLGIRLEVENNIVTEAFCSGEMFRGFEVILKGREPLDAQQITQRICGVCPVSHGMASVLAQEDAYGIEPPLNGRLARNIMLAANYIQSHIIHFYHLSALDFIDIAAITKYNGGDPVLNGLKGWVNIELSSNKIFPVSPFLPRFEGDYTDNTDLNITAIKHYLDALEMRATAHRLVALFSGKIPHIASLVPGGITDSITAMKIAAADSLLTRLEHFIETAYIPDVLAVAEAFPSYFKTGKGVDNFLSYGVFREHGSNKPFLPSGVLINGETKALQSSVITEDIKHSFYSSESGLTPESGTTIPSPDKTGAYSWLKSPRYLSQPMEVGPLARMMIAYQKKEPGVVTAVDGLLNVTGKTASDLVSVMGRHAARALECKLVAEKCRDWIDRLRPGHDTATPFKIPQTGTGVGLTEAPRGALGHWLSIKGKKIDLYQCVVPTTWNCSPKDDSGKPGPVETALKGTPVQNSKNPIEAMRVVRSFDPCLACAVH